MALDHIQVRLVVAWAMFVRARMLINPYSEEETLKHYAEREVHKAHSETRCRWMQPQPALQS